MTDGSIIIFNFADKKYKKYSPTGHLLNSCAERPLELGAVKRSRQIDGAYQYTVKYDDITYSITSEKIEEQGFQRDIFLNLFFIGRITDPDDIYINAEREDNTVSEKPIPHYIVTRYDRCNDSSERLHIPVDKSPFKKTDKGVIRDESFLNQYGKPVVSPNGDVYCWKRTSDKYSIIKWIWLDSSDSPLNLEAKVLRGDISLTWERSNEDTHKVTGYEILRSTNICSPFEEIGEVKKDVLNYVDKDVKAGEVYYYQVRAIKDKEYSGYSNKAVGSIVK